MELAAEWRGLESWQGKGSSFGVKWQPEMLLWLEENGYLFQPIAASLYIKVFSLSLYLSKDNLQESVFSFYHVGPSGTQPGLAASTGTS